MSELQPKSAAASLTLRSAIALAVAFAVSRAGIPLPEGAVENLVGSAIDLVASLSFIGIAIGRARAKAPLA
jgi:hypothetical protein